LVFPFFLVIMGVSMAISFAKRRPSLAKVLRRTALLFALGFFLNAFPHFDPTEVHIMGVLQRIALVYLATALLILYAPRKSRLALAGAGAAWAPLFPINKTLWTSSYVLFTGGCALILLALTYEFVEVRGFRKLGRPFEVLGLNAILVYMASEELAYAVDSTHF